MNALSLPAFSFFPWTSRKSEQMTDRTIKTDDAERHRIVGEMIAAGACDSEYGVQMLMSVFQMLMSVFPDRF